MPELEAILSDLTRLGEQLADRVCADVRTRGTGHAAEIHSSSASDVIYRIDHVAESVLLGNLPALASEYGGLTLVAEGIGESDITEFPDGTGSGSTRWRLLIDPIDGTRGLMVDKRPAFFLAVIAPDNGNHTRLADICAAVMVEIPTTKMYLSDTLSAVRNKGVKGTRRNLITGNNEHFQPEPYSSGNIRGGFAQLARFFSPGKELLARLEEELLAALYPDARPGEIVAFEDQYISSGGQLYELLTGKDRFVGDIRGSLYRAYSGKLRPGHVCHPYDLAAHLIGSEAGLVITGIDGQPLDGPFSTTHPMDWIGYANSQIFDEVSPVLNFLIKKYKLL